jgi:mevalonate pyrophosphate decarboxylase
MDAGPNVHLLFRPEQLEMAKSLKEKCEALNLKVYSNRV